MPVTVTYQSGTPLIVTLNAETIDVVAVPGGSYRHNDRPVANLFFTLPQGTPSGKINVSSPPPQAMPAQTCVTVYHKNKVGVFKSEWQMTSATTGVMTLTIPDPTSSQFLGRMNIVNADLMNITLTRT